LFVCFTGNTAIQGAAKKGTPEFFHRFLINRLEF